IRTQHPLGSRIYHGVWEAIARNNLVAGLQYGGVPGVPPTPTDLVTRAGGRHDKVLHAVNPGGCDHPDPRKPIPAERRRRRDRVAFARVHIERGDPAGRRTGAQCGSQRGTCVGRGASLWGRRAGV
ncbi:MAG: hypothetical protein ACRDQD_27440, partial [Nocardioidaceae bacterium]